MNSSYGYRKWCDVRKEWREKKTNLTKEKKYLTEKDKNIITNHTIIEHRAYILKGWIRLSDLIKSYGWYFDIAYYRTLEKKHGISLL